MTKVFGSVVLVFALLGVWASLHVRGDRRLQVTAGRTTLSFYPSVLAANHLKVDLSPSADGDKATAEASTGYQIAFSNLRFSVNDGRFTGYNGGQISHKGGFRLVSGGNSVNADQFILSPSPVTTDGLQLTVDSRKEAFVAFDLVRGRAAYMLKEKQLLVGTLDLLISVRCAQELKRPELAGQVIGSLKVFGEADPIDGGGDVEVSSQADNVRTTGVIDLALSDMGSLSSLGRVGTYPNGTNGLAMYTTSCNVGTLNIPWNAPMATTHPAITMNLYRVLNGRFEQIGWSWMKHGFFATNASQCGSCQSPHTGTLLGLACSDTYAVGNNSDQFYLGGRDEINAFTGAWTCQGSYFSNYVNDCTRRNTGSGLTAVDHRLVVRDADLGNTGAHYYYEARYINANDVNTYNNIASREATTTWNNSQWNFVTIDSAEVMGPAINRWGEFRSTAQPQNEGDVIVAVQTTSLGAGMWHYDYAVYNHTSDRQVRTFSVPMPSGMIVQNIAFRDIDQDATNDWPGVYANDSITWSTGAFGTSTANPLKFASVFNFRFDSNVPPVASIARLGLFKSGTNKGLTAATKAPVLLQPVTAVSILNGAVISGKVPSLAHWDGNRMTLSGNADAGTGLIATGVAPTASPTALIVGVVSSAGLIAPAGGPTSQSMELWNWTTNSWESVDTRTVTTLDSMALVTISSNAARFVHTGDLRVQARIMQSGTLLSGEVRHPRFDQIGFQFN